jgi:S-adenosylmethionine/arginine decarboxylase-like enzyme
MSNYTNPPGYQPWGKSVSINLFDCNLKIISDPHSIQKYVKDVIEKIDMIAHGPCIIDRFGEGQLEGYSAMQFIETSSITVHCDEPEKRCFVDIFSCKDFDTKLAKRFTVRFFQAKRATSITLVR